MKGSNSATAPTWAELIEAEPELRAFEHDAEQAGRNGADYWLSWVRTFGTFRDLIYRVQSKFFAQRAEAAVLAHLADIFHAAEQREVEQAPPPPPPPRPAAVTTQPITVISSAPKPGRTPAWARGAKLPDMEEIDDDDTENPYSRWPRR
jgi:hypothetical protein